MNKPHFTQEQLIQVAKLSDADIRIVNECRGEHNKLGFAYQLCYVKLFNRLPMQRPLELLDGQATFITVQLDIGYFWATPRKGVNGNVKIPNYGGYFTRVFNFTFQNFPIWKNVAAFGNFSEFSALLRKFYSFMMSNLSENRINYFQFILKRRFSPILFMDLKSMTHNLLYHLNVNLLFLDHPGSDLRSEKMPAIMRGPGDVKVLIKYPIDVTRC